MQDHEIDPTVAGLAGDFAHLAAALSASTRTLHARNTLFTAAELARTVADTEATAARLADAIHRLRACLRWARANPDR